MQTVSADRQYFWTPIPGTDAGYGTRYQCNVCNIRLYTFSARTMHDMDCDMQNPRGWWWLCQQ